MQNISKPLNNLCDNNLRTIQSANLPKDAIILYHSRYDSSDHKASLIDGAQRRRIIRKISKMFFFFFVGFVIRST